MPESYGTRPPIQLGAPSVYFLASLSIGVGRPTKEEEELLEVVEAVVINSRSHQPSHSITK